MTIFHDDDYDGFDFDGAYEYVRETDLAILFRKQGGSRWSDKPTLWVPKSVIHDDSECYAKGTSGKLVVKRKWAEDAGYL